MPTWMARPFATLIEGGSSSADGIRRHLQSNIRRPTVAVALPVSGPASRFGAPELGVSAATGREATQMNVQGRGWFAWLWAVVSSPRSAGATGQDGDRAARLRARSIEDGIAIALAVCALVMTVTTGGWHGTGAPYLLVAPVWMLARRQWMRAGAPAAASCALVAWLLWDAGVLRNISLTLLLAFAVVAGREARAARRPAERDGAERAGAAPTRVAATRLTSREQEVLRLLATGHTNKEAAARLGLSVRTIESHRAKIVDKLGCAGRSDLFRHAREFGMLDRGGELEAAAALASS
jgi:DNA-binding CsgD family transcriptional regulator